MNNLRKVSIWKERPRECSGRTAMERASIIELGLNQRAYNGLKRAGCNSVGDVLAIIGENGEGIKSVRNLGEKSQKEIMDKLAVLAENYKTSSINSYSNDNRTVLLKPNGNTWNKDIVDLGLSDLASRQLRQSGIMKIGDIYSPFLKADPGWIAVRELLERIVGEVIR